MDKKQWKTVAISAATLLLLFLLVIWVFRDHYQEILRNIQAVSIRELLLLLGMGLAYQMLESAVCFAMIRRRLPTFSYRQAVEVTFLGVFGNVSTLSVGSDSHAKLLPASLRYDDRLWHWYHDAGVHIS